MSFNQEVNIERQGFVWGKSLDAGDSPIIFNNCRRFILSRLQEDSAPRTQIYYLNPQGQWFEYMEEFVQASTDANDIIIDWDMREAKPEEVAHQMLNCPSLGGNLFPELTKYRDFGDYQVFAEWKNQDRIETELARDKMCKLHPNWDGQNLYIGIHKCKSFTRTKNNQTRMLDEFQRQDWPPAIRNPFENEFTFSQTIKDMNKWETSPVSFRRSGFFVSWIFERELVP